MARVRDRDLRHYPIKNSGALRSSAIPSWRRPFLTDCFTTLWRCQINWRPLIAARRTLFASSNLCREGPPLSQSDQTSLLVNLSGDVMAFQIEMVLNLVVN
jgi:hypothetical protein